MNERIKELFGEALDKHVPYTWTKLGAEELDNVMVEFTNLLLQELTNACDEQKADYIKYQKNSWDREEKEIYAEGAAACDTLKYRIKRILKSK